MPKYRANGDTPIDAVQFHGENWDQLYSLEDTGSITRIKEFHKAFTLQTSDGEVTGEMGDWLVKGSDGQLSRVKNAVFHIAFEPAGDE